MLSSLLNLSSALQTNLHQTPGLPESARDRDQWEGKGRASVLPSGEAPSAGRRALPWRTWRAGQPLNLPGKRGPSCGHGLLDGEGAEWPIATCHLTQWGQESHPGEGHSK